MTAFRTGKAYINQNGPQATVSTNSADDWLTVPHGDCRAVLIDLNGEYLDQLRGRNSQVAPGTEGVA